MAMQNGRDVTETIDVVALVTAVFVPPIGLGLGVAGLVRSKKRELRPSFASVIATLLGGLALLAAVVVVFLLVAVGSAAEDRKNAVAFCDRFTADPDPLADLKPLYEELVATDTGVVDAEHTSAQLEAAQARVDELRFRLPIGSVGRGITVYQQWGDIYNSLGEASDTMAAQLASGVADTGSGYMGDLSYAVSVAPDVLNSTTEFCGTL